MGKYTALVDLILENDDYLSLLREAKNYYTKTFDEFLKVIQDFNERIKKFGIETSLVSDPSGKLTFVVNQGYQNDKNRVLQVNSYNNGTVECDSSVRFRAPGCTNLNALVDANQILKILDGYVYSLERDQKNQNSQQVGNTEKKEDEKGDSENKGESFKLDDALVSILDNLKTTGDSLLTKAKSVPAVEFNGKKYKIDGGDVMASTEQEAILSLTFPRDQEIDIYSSDKNGQALRRSILKAFQNAGFKKATNPQFRLDMEKTPYFYIPIGKMPVKKTTGPEAKAMINYFDGKKVRFQPKER